MSGKFILCDHGRNSHDHFVLQSIDITRRNLMLVTLIGLNKGLNIHCIYIPWSSVMQTLQQCCSACSSSCHSFIPGDAKKGESHSLCLFLFNDIVIFYIFIDKTILFLNFVKYLIMLTNSHFFYALS